MLKNVKFIDMEKKYRNEKGLIYNISQIKKSHYQLWQEVNENGNPVGKWLTTEEVINDIIF